METGELPRPSRLRRLAREVMPLLVLIAVGCKANCDEWQIRELTATDETWYLGIAWHMSDPGALPAEYHPMYTPLYVGLYRVLLCLPVEVEYLPFVCHALLLTLLGCVFYALTRRLGVGRWLSAAAATVLIHGTRLAEVEPFPVHLATIVFALGVWAGTFRRSLLGACGPIGFGTLAACYARNEFGTFLLAFVPCYLAVGAWALWRRADSRVEFLRWAVPLVLAVGACAAALGLPMPDGPRGIFAFGQHYARNVVEARGGEVVDWAVHYKRILRADFGNVHTVGEAARARPGALAWHVGRNFHRLPEATLGLCQPRVLWRPDYELPAKVLLWTVLGLGLVGFLRRVWAGACRGPDGLPLRVVLFGLGCVALVSGPSVVVVFPRDHYLLLPLFFALTLVVSGLPAPRWASGWAGVPTAWKTRTAGFFAAAFILGAMPTASEKRTFLRPLVTQYHPPTTGELRDTMALLRQLPRKPGTVVLDHRYMSTVLTVWMAQPVTFVSHDLKREGFGAFVAKHGIEVVILERALLDEPAFAGDQEFLELWNETHTGPFVVLACGHARVAVRRDLVPRE
jgi:hypothetical protein